MHEKSLEPSLGRPDRQTEMNALCSREEERNKAFSLFIKEHTQTMREEQTNIFYKFVLELLNGVKSLMNLLDGVTSSSEIAISMYSAMTDKLGPLIEMSFIQTFN